MPEIKAYAATTATSPLGPFELTRRDPGPHDVALQISHCGVCHSDLHIARNEWGMTQYPCVPGHEIVGTVTAVGSKVTKFKEGDRAAIGCMVDSCRTCSTCQQGLEQYCEQGMTLTYNSEDKVSGGITFGGYSEAIVADEAFVLRLAESLDPAASAPLLCAGITTWSPLKHWGVGSGMRVGVVGLGGLGHMGVKLAASLGADVVLFTRSPGKEEDALRLGAKEVVVSTREAEMEKQQGRFDFILDTVAAEHDLNAYLNLLKLDGTMTLVGLPEKPLSVVPFNLVWPRRNLAGSLIGGIAETQELLDYCAEHGITSDIELISVDQVNEAYERMLRSDVKYRFVMDLATLN